MTNRYGNPPRYGIAEVLAPGVRRVLAPNPSPMTLHGTNSYIIGAGQVAVIDPGPDNADHLNALLAALAPGERISHILVTHAHLDHSPLARPLADATGAPVLAFGDARAGRSALMEKLSAQGGLEGGEGVDTGFSPDIHLCDGEEINGSGWCLHALHTPGHFGNHLSFQLDDMIFCGDHVMGWASSLVSPPDGDMGAYMASLRRLADTGVKHLHSGHGDPIADAQSRISDLIAHRQAREEAILRALRDGPTDATTLARRIYTDTPPTMMRAAARNVLAHLIDLTERKQVKAQTPLAPSTQFSLL
ncbi:MAG: MBL fold metallo-hydrolase [Albidovulum sp.]|uniref:MBL fold metallo-hydrolase n=1 Tax=Albidovulum sp. TaxID=1872424 RepID=UPI003CA5A287